VGHLDSYFSRDDCPPEVPGTSRLGNNSSANNIVSSGYLLTVGTLSNV